MPSKLIDIHPHVISTDTVRFPLAPLGGKQSTWSAEHPLNYEDLVRAMDAAGVDKAALVQASSAYAFDNSYVAAAIAAYPKRFTGVFSIDMLAPDAVQKMKLWMGKGLTGMRLFTSGSAMPEQSTWFADERTFPAWQFASDAGIPVCMQMRMEGIPILRQVLDRFPKLKVVIDHLARVELSNGPPYGSAVPLIELALYPNVYLKVTHRPIEASHKGSSTPKAFFSLLVKSFGARRIAWGSNFPAAPQKLPDLVKLAKDALAFLPPADQEWIFAKTAQSLYPVLADK